MMQDLVLFLWLAAVMLTLDWQLSILALSALPLIGFGLVKMGRRVRALTEEQISIGHAISVRLADVLAAIRFIKASDTADLELERHRALTKRRKRLSVDLAQTKAAADPLVGIASGLAIGGTILVARRAWPKRAPKPSARSRRFSSRSSSCTGRCKRLSTSVIHLQSGLIAAQKIRAALNELRGGSGAAAHEAVQGDALRRRDQRRPFQLRRQGRRAARRLDDARRRGDRRAGRPLGRRQIHVAQPDPPSLRALRRDDQDRWHRCPRFQPVEPAAVDRVGQPGRDSPGRYGQGQHHLRRRRCPRTRRACGRRSTMPARSTSCGSCRRVWTRRVGERGSFFSGGQRQRLALARALYREAPILLLDEPTSSLDRDLEQDIREALTRLAGKKTILIVSHRLPIVEFADRIYVMLKGEIVEAGTHAELMRRDGVYARLFGIQDLERTLGMSLTT